MDVCGAVSLAGRPTPLGRTGFDGPSAWRLGRALPLTDTDARPDLLGGMTRASKVRDELVKLRRLHQSGFC